MRHRAAVTARHRPAPVVAESTGPRSHRTPIVVVLAAALGLTVAGATVLVQQGADTSTRGASAVVSDTPSDSLDGSFGPASTPSTGSPSYSGTGGVIGGNPSGFDPSATGTVPGASAGTSAAAPGGTTAAPPAAGSSPAATTAGTAAAPPAAPVTPSAVNSHPTSVNITSNIIASPASDPSCASAPTGAACVNAGVAALNHARAVLGLPAYAVPANFASLTAAQQLLTLSNLDRVLYGLAPINGLNATVSAAAQAGVTNGGDPVGVAVGSAAWHAWASNWASGYPNAAYTYYAWMYDDGPGSPNADCTSAGAPGCWGHRLNTLYSFGAGVQIAMGVGNSGKVFTELYESFATSASIPYS